MMNSSLREFIYLEKQKLDRFESLADSLTPDLILSTKDWKILYESYQKELSDFASNLKSVSDTVDGSSS